MESLQVPSPIAPTTYVNTSVFKEQKNELLQTFIHCSCDEVDVAARVL